ncbi:hypothetical protein CRYUN_Cryun12cG0070300 [Craigia yunnanensis]
MAASSSSVAAVRSWRTAFLTLRDETLTNPPSIPQLVQSLIFSHSHSSFISAAPDLPAHEIHDVSRRVSLDMNSSSWTLLLDSFSKMMAFFLAKPTSNAALYKPVLECLETLRYLVSENQRKCSLSDDIQLVNFLIHVITGSHVDLISLYRPSGNLKSAIEIGKKLPRYGSLWEVQTVAFTMLGEVYSRTGSSFPVDMWQSTIQVLRKMMDLLDSKNLVVDDIVMLSIHKQFFLLCTGFMHLFSIAFIWFLWILKVLFLNMCLVLWHPCEFFSIMALLVDPNSCVAIGCKGKEPGSLSLKLTTEEPKRTNNTPYRPPHLRKKAGLTLRQAKAQDPQSSSDHDSSMVDVTSSDSDYSDNDGSLKDINGSRCSKVRVSAIVCVQDLCQADPKSFTSQWTMLLPTNDVLQLRKFEATLMASLLFDPYLKAWMASASALAVMMDGPTTVFPQVAEYKESTKCGPFMALSSSLGQILMQLHTGILYLIQHETNSWLLVLVFKILMLLISCTPYSRMPGELLPKVILSLQARIEAGFPFKSDQTGPQVAAASCLTAALSVSPSIQVKEMILKEGSTGFVEADKKSGVLFTLLQHSARLSNPTICFEALQALRAVSHNYPDLMVPLNFGGLETPEAHPVNQTHGRPADCSCQNTPFTSDCIRTKKVSSAPSYGSQSLEDTKEERNTCSSGIEQRAETVEKHMPIILWHTSAMVRTASRTCFAGITSSVFFILTKEKQDFVVSSLISAAKHDKAPLVRSAACRAIGVVSCFLKSSESAEIVGKFIHAFEVNTRDPVVSVRIPASWALANICDSLRHFVDDFPLKQSTYSETNSQLVELLTKCALRLTKDGDKIKSNAVRALGNLARFVRYTSSSCVHDKPVADTEFSSTCKNVTMLPARSDLNAFDGGVIN